MNTKDLTKALLLPLALLNDVIKSQRSKAKKISYIIIVVIIFGSIWVDAIKSSLTFVNVGLFELGITDKVIKVPVSGTSMLPTIKDGSEIDLNSPKKFGLERGDIVSFKNIETGNIYYLKRIIGLPGEKISIKNGYYYIDGKALEENYTLNSLPTFGNTFLSDCEQVDIPKGSYFVSGDNRTVSSDSRVLGLINENDIDGVIKTKIGEKFTDSEKQLRLTEVNIDSQTFLKALNSRRVKEKSSNLVTHTLLNQIAGDRALQISKDFDNWKKNSVPLDKLLDAKGYRFNSVYEFVTFGYLGEDDIVNQIFELQNEKDKFSGGSFTEVGIGISERTYKECKYPVISVVLSWPSVPTYDKSIVDSWAQEVTLTNTLISNMQTWIGRAGIDQQKLRQIITNAAEENEIAKRIYGKMSTNQWLSAKDYQDIGRHDASIKETEKLLDEVFGSDVKGVSTKRGEVRKILN